MIRRVAALVAISFWAVALWGLSLGPANAADPKQHVLKPNLYVFGAEHCGHCQRAVQFLRKLQASDPRFKLTEYDIERSSEEAELFIRVVLSIGLQEAFVPMVIIGPHVLLGFDDDTTSGPQILKYLDVCRTEACPDFVAELTMPEPSASAKPAWRVQYRWAEAAQRR